MKIILITLSVLTTFTLAPRSAHALGDTEAAILGGVLGGALIAVAIDNALDHEAPYYVVAGHGYDRSRDPGYRRGHGPSCGCGACRSPAHHNYGRGHDRDHAPNGHWTYRTVKVWVPKSVSYSYDRWGRPTKHFRRGYWSYRQEKIWVSNRGRW